MIEGTDLLDELLGDVRGLAVLDVGCGGGWLVRRMADAGADAIGVDPAAGALADASRYVAGRAQALPFDDGRFDVVVLFNSLHHVPEESLDRALAEAARVLRAGGRLYVQEPVAAGDFFELVSAVDDETRVRVAAQQALDRAAGAGLRELARRDETVAMRLADFHGLEHALLGADPARADAVAEHEHELRHGFERLGRRTDDGWEFAMPVTVRLFART
jgi:SAM-dependent methyltransferase